MKHILCLFTLLITGFYGFAQTSETKMKLDTSLISYVEFVKLNAGEPAKSVKKQLSANQYTAFATTWNSKRSIGADKFKIYYYIYVFLKDGKKRQFTIGGSKVQEQSWMTMDFGDPLYFNTLWNDTK